MSQWTTFPSGPLAPQIWPENRVKVPNSCELVVHFPEWTTGSFDLAGKGVKSPISCELVVHFVEWTTSSFDFAGKRGGGSAALDTNKEFSLKPKRKRLTNSDPSATLK